MRQLARRQFLCCVGGASTLAAFSLMPRAQSHSAFASDVDTHQNINDDELPCITRRSRALGSNVSITALHRSATVAERAIEAAFAELELIEDLMSIYRPQSQLARLNRLRILVDPHPFLVQLLQIAQNHARETKGAFDITIQPLWELYADRQTVGELPSEAQIQAARRRVDWRRVEVQSDCIRLRGEGTKVTLNGIAQGFAADRVTQILQAHGIQHALIDTGEIGTIGRRAPDREWMVGIQHPRHEAAYVSVAALSGRCLATSGDYATSFSADYEHHHLFDPRTGRSPRELSSVTVAANTAMEADWLSTALFVLGCELGMPLIQRTPGADAMLICKDGRAIVSSGFPRA